MDETGDVREPGTLAERLREVWVAAARDGRAMPGEPVLSATLSTSRPAVREALVRLEERGYIRRRKGADTVVNPAALDIPARFDEQLDKAELIASMGRTARVEVVAATVGPVTRLEVDTYDIAPNVLVLRTTKLWYADEVPVVLARDTVPVPGRTKAEAADPQRPVFDLVAELSGDHVEWEIAWPGAANLSPDDAGMLRRPAGEASLAFELVGVGRSGRTAYWADERHVHGAFRYALIRSVRVR